MALGGQGWWRRPQVVVASSAAGVGVVLFVLLGGPRPADIASATATIQVSGSNIAITTTRASAKYCATGATQDLASLQPDPEKLNTASWQTSNITVTAAGIAGPDSLTSNTWTITDTGAAGLHVLYTRSGGTGTFSYSVYAKAGTSRYATLYFDTTSWGVYDLQVGTVAGTGGGAIGLITSAANGWWRISLSGTSGGNGLAYVGPDPAGTLSFAVSYAGTGSTIYVADTKLENASSPTAYKFTNGKNNQAISQLTNNQPCIDPIGINAEGPTTNLVLQSQAIDNAAWTGSQAGTGTVPVITPNVAISPDGTLTAEQVALSAVADGAAASSIYQGFTATAAAYTFSIYLRAASGTATVWVWLGNAAYGATQCNLTTTWVRCVTPAVTLTAATYFAQFGVNAGLGGQTTEPAQTIYAWGGQVELGALATSYVPTVAATATRAADTFSSNAQLPIVNSAGSVRTCFTPNWTGAPPSGFNLVTLNGTSLLYFNNVDQNVYSYNGSVALGLGGGFQAGVKKCYRLSWTPASRTIYNVTDGTSATSATGFPVFADTTLVFGFGATATATGIFSDLCVAATPGGCT